MKRPAYPRTLLLGTTCAVLLASAAWSVDFNIPAGDLESALNAYTSTTGVDLIVATDAIKGVRTRGASGEISPDAALSRLLSGTGFHAQRQPSGAIAIISGRQSSADIQPMQLAQAAPSPRTAVETVTVTSSKLGGADVQSIPISITALSQEQLTATQTAGGPDLVKQVPNLTFTKTNFTGYSIQIRGIGTQAISVTTDPAVAVAFNDIPFIRNHFFEQEFYDVSQVEVLRGPQGTLYGRNATAGVVNLVSAKPTDQFEALASGDIGNYKNRRFEGMINIPIVDDRLDLRLAGEWTKRSGYSINELTGQNIDGRDLWSTRATLGWKPAPGIQVYLVWEHFQENDDRMRTAKQLCKTAPIPESIGGASVPSPTAPGGSVGGYLNPANYLSQGCLPASLYAPESFEVPNGYTLPYVTAVKAVGMLNIAVDPYASTSQSRDLRAIETTLDPKYRARNDTLEANIDYDITPDLKFSSQTGYNNDFLWSTEDYNRFSTSPGIFVADGGNQSIRQASLLSSNGVFCDPQVGCADRLVAQDLSDETAWQFSQEIRLASNFSGPLNFSVGGNYLRYGTEENYYVFINALTLYAAAGSNLLDQEDYPWVPGVSDNHECNLNYGGLVFHNPARGGGEPTVNQCNYIDPNPLTSLNNNGHNYFLSQNPYDLISYAGFGEVYYNVLSDLKLTGGLRWTEDRKHFVDIPSEVIANGWGYPSVGTVDQQWDKLTGRAAINWTPKLDFTDQTLIYGSYAHGYKAGGANPPGAVLLKLGGSGTGAINLPDHPLTFEPEFVNAYELGTKNTLLDGALTFNASGFLYKYKGYQISEIVDRTAINLNFDANVKGAEVEASWEPMPGLRFKFGGGYEDARAADGQTALDLIDRSAGTPGWMVVKPSVTQASNCVLPVYVVSAILQNPNSMASAGEALSQGCGLAYNLGLDPVTGLAYMPNPTAVDPGPGGRGFPLYIPPGYPGFDPISATATNNGAGPAPNEGAGFFKDVSGNELPNAPHFTVSLGADFTLPVTSDWAATLHSDFYWQSNSYARIINDDPYDKLRGYTNVNLALILTSQNGWQVMGYLKNVFNTTAITGTFLNSDDTGLTTNVFLTDPRLFGVRVTKNW
jgi:outer membrane receptor protein involved in Fe transport